MAQKLVDAAWQSCTQFRQTRDALRKARVEEAKALESERKRKEKEAQAEKVREEKRAQKEAAKAAKAAKAASEKPQDDAAPANAEAEAEAAEDPKRKPRRRGKGLDELGDSDAPVLRHRFPDHEAAVYEGLEDWLECVGAGKPCIFRSRRSSLKKVLSSSTTLDQRDAKSANVQLQAEIKKFLADFVEKIQQEPSSSKVSKAASSVLQAVLPDLALDSTIRHLVEEEANAQGAQEENAPEDWPPKLCMDRADFLEMLEHTAFEIKKDFPSEQDWKGVLQDVGIFKVITLVACPHGSFWSGVIQYPHFHYQMEGSRVMAMASIPDAPCLI